jgi:hypothetical protein
MLLRSVARWLGGPFSVEGDARAAPLRKGTGKQNAPPEQGKVRFWSSWIKLASNKP